MNRQSQTAFSTSLLLSIALPLAAAAPEPIITVRVFDYAEVPAKVAAKARREAARIFQRSGVETEWVACSLAEEAEPSDSRCTARMGATDIVMRILPTEGASSKRHSEFGVALIPVDGGFGRHASVFFTRVEEYAARWQASEGLLLGHLMAHEVGHLLLGVNSHSQSGIMGVPWTRGKILKACLGTLLFTRREGSRMREQAVARMADTGRPLRYERLVSLLQE